MSPPPTLFSSHRHRTQSVPCDTSPVAPFVPGVVIVTGETPWCQDPGSDIVNHPTLRTLPESPSIQYPLGPFLSDYPWLRVVHDDILLVECLSRPQEARFNHHLQRTTRLCLKHQMVICIFRNIPTILHPFVEKSVNQPWAAWLGIKCVQFNIPSRVFQGLMGEYFPNNWKQSATRPGSYCPHSDNEAMMLWPG